MIKEFIKENHHTNQQGERLIAGNNLTKNKRDQFQRKEKTAAVVRRHRTVPFDECLRGIARNLHLSSRNANFYEVENILSDGGEAL